MHTSYKHTIINTLIGSGITGIISLAIFFLGDYSSTATIEKKTVETLSNYFEYVDKNMTYEQAIQEIYSEKRDLETQISKLKKEIDDKEYEITQQNHQKEVEEIVKSATEYGNNGDYIQAITLLSNIETKSTQLESLINDYEKKYETDIVDKVTILQADVQLEEASVLIEDALKIVPDSVKLNESKRVIENSLPVNMLEKVAAYQSGGNTYKEYDAYRTGATEYFCMGGKKYTNGMTFNADINIFNDVSWAVYNLEGKYSSLEFDLGHVDGTDLGRETFLEVFYDGQLTDEISVTPDMLPKHIILNLEGVKQLKLQVHASGNDGPLYGLGDPIIKLS